MELTPEQLAVLARIQAGAFGQLQPTQDPSAMNLVFRGETPAATNPVFRPGVDNTPVMRAGGMQGPDTPGPGALRELAKALPSRAMLDYPDATMGAGDSFSPMPTGNFTGRFNEGVPNTLPPPPEYGGPDTPLARANFAMPDAVMPQMREPMNPARGMPQSAPAMAGGAGPTGGSSTMPTPRPGFAGVEPGLWGQTSPPSGQRLSEIPPEQMPGGRMLGKVPMPEMFMGTNPSIGPGGKVSVQGWDEEQAALAQAIARDQQAAGGGQGGGGFLSGIFGAPGSDRREDFQNMALGWAMGAGGTWQDSLAGGAKMVAAGRVTRKEKAEAKKSLTATQKLALSKGLSEEEVAAFGEDGKGLLQYTIDRSKATQPEYRTLTDPAERARYGIPQSDQAVYQLGTDGKINRVGEGGVKLTINDEIDQRRRAAAAFGLDPNSPQGQSYILTGKMPREDQQPLTATDKKAILEADEMVSAAQGALPLIDRALELSDKAYTGWGAGTRGSVGAMFGVEGGNETVEYDNLVTEQALSQMKAIFGGNPTEGERAILLDIAGSSSMPPDVRKNVLARARSAVERRLNLYKQRADQLRGQTFYDAGGGVTGPAAPAGVSAPPGTNPPAADPLGIRN